VVTTGDTLTAVPLVTVIFPGVITPVPLEKVPVRLVELPYEMVLEDAVKLLMEGMGSTITVISCVTDVFSELVTVSV